MSNCPHCGQPIPAPAMAVVSEREWREMLAASSRLLAEADSLRRQGRESSAVWKVLGPLNRRIRAVVDVHPA